MLVFVYGTMKKGGALNKAYMSASKYKAEALVSGYWMFDMGPYPALAYTGNKHQLVKGEVWDMPDAAWTRLKNMEEGAGYNVGTALTDVNGAKQTVHLFVRIDLTVPGTSCWDNDNVIFEEKK